MVESRIWRYLLILLGILWCSGCTSKHSPAPVVTLNSQPPSKDFHYSGDTYTVKTGDTLFAIAWYANKDYQDIARFNRLQAPYNIYPGQKLRLTPPQTVAKTNNNSSYNKQKGSGQTSPPKAQKRVDQPEKQAYGDRKNNVNNQSVKRVKSPTVSAKYSARRRFPERVAEWVWPASGRVTETFNQNESGRKGIIISGARGAAVKAAAAGKVVYAGNGLRGYGNLIIVKHTDSLLSAYAHNDQITVKEQQWVKAGQTIGSMGDSGTNIVKLHFEVRYRGKSLDPLRYLPQRSK
ncbi:peptidoglycan DD-metalloendopeptidase family protein [Salinimonas chungwhensis]|uniref:peptidoglycan DD-metalloendopeptidase family protein n=1 Tax=Salinimonas chungwhensis TaxID=265425 RepID=UPI00035EF00D|nr:peptidoglycan DD-metalloendopeptidase family protein [Salinimonas chungwhensis]